MMTRITCVQPTNGVNFLADIIKPGTWKGSEPIGAWFEPGGWLYEQHESKVAMPLGSDPPKAATTMMTSLKDNPEGIAAGERETRPSSREVPISGGTMMASAQEKPKSHAINDADTPPSTIKSKGV